MIHGQNDVYLPWDGDVMMCSEIWTLSEVGENVDGYVVERASFYALSVALKKRYI